MNEAQMTRGQDMLPFTSWRAWAQCKGPRLEHKQKAGWLKNTGRNAGARTRRLGHAALGPICSQIQPFLSLLSIGLQELA